MKKLKAERAAEKAAEIKGAARHEKAL